MAYCKFHWHSGMREQSFIVISRNIDITRIDYNSDSRDVILTKSGRIFIKRDPNIAKEKG